MENQASFAASPDAAVWMAEVKEQLVAAISAALVAMGGIVACLLLPGAGFQLDRFMVFFTLVLTGLAAYRSRERYPHLAQTVLLVGPTVSVALALRSFSTPVVLCFAVLAVIANGAVRPLWGFVAAGMNTIPLYALVPNREFLLPALALLWLSAATQWLSSRGLYMALEWAWQGQRRANRLLDELRERQGKLNQTLAALTEATRRLQHTGYDLAVARVRADEARQMKEQFAANISHELRTPLNLILGFSEMMYHTPDVYGDMVWPSTLRRDVQQIYQSSRHLLALVNDVLDLARVDAGQMPVCRELSDLGDVITEAVETVRDLERKRGVQLRTDLPAALPRLNIDRTRVRQILLNLLNNAARFTSQGYITVAARADEREVIVSVADTGVGIAPEELAKVFDEFYQVDMSLRRPSGGAGLGLAICKRFVELHGGRLWAESVVGQGSTFSFSLPLAPETAAGPLVASPAVRPALGPDDQCVLVIDPDPAIGTMLGRQLKRQHIVQAEDPVKARDLAAELRPKAVLLNVAPDEASRQEAHRYAEALPPQTAVVLCSLPSQSWMATRANVRACLSKPIERGQLLRTLHELGRADDILIVDDDGGFVQLVTRFLAGSPAPFKVRWAREGEEGLMQVARQRPDVILLDMAMPGMDGSRFLEALQARPDGDTIPVLVITAATYSEDLLAQRGSSIQVARRHGFSTGEVIKYLQALLDAMGIAGQGESGPAPAGIASGQPVWPES